MRQRQAISLITAVCVASFSSAYADMEDITANAKISSPLTISSASSLEFGEVTRPNTGQCDYELGPDSELIVSGGSDCMAMSGTPFAAEFTINCAVDVLVRFELTYENQAPDGAVFSAGENSMDIDGRGAGDVLQVTGCDSDGQTQVSAGGRLSVTPTAPDDFTGTVGTIRLEAIYD